MERGEEEQEEGRGEREKEGDGGVFGVCVGGGG